MSATLLDVTTIYLEMRAPPSAAPPSAPRADLAIVHARRPTVAYYRFLYDTVGAPWLWYERRRLDDAALAAIVQDPAVEVHVLHAAGVPAGYLELDRRQPGAIEVAYFGLMPEFIGQRLGGFLLGWGVARAWQARPDRLWVHTCSLDHPGALATYHRAGFVEYQRVADQIADPRHP